MFLRFKWIIRYSWNSSTANNERTTYGSTSIVLRMANPFSPTKQELFGAKVSAFYTYIWCLLCFMTFLNLVSNGEPYNSPNSLFRAIVVSNSPNCFIMAHPLPAQWMLFGKTTRWILGQEACLQVHKGKSTIHVQPILVCFCKVKQFYKQNKQIYVILCYNAFQK